MILLDSKLSRRKFLSSLLLGSSALMVSQAVNAKSEQIVIGGAVISIVYDGNFPEVLKAEITKWVKSSASAVAHYYGAFPVKECTVLLHAEDGDGIGVSSAEFQRGRVTVDVPIGVSTVAQQLNDDWVLTHEMVHLAFPLVYPKDRWLVEGMATYVEPFARMQIGRLSAKSVWGDLYRRGPSGMARDASEIFSKSHRIDRLYWGGAIYCLQLDLVLRSSSQNRIGLQQALSAVVKAGANFDSDMEPREAFALGDKALGINTLVKYYDRYVNSSENPDLAKIFSDLGVRKGEGGIKFDDQAPLANLRLAINAGR